MQVPSGKIEKAASTDEARPVLTCVHLRTDADGSRWLEATDSYKLVRLPAVDAENDADGLIPASAFSEARKVRNGGSVSRTGEGSVSYSLKAGGEAVVPAARITTGQFPNVPPLFPEGEPSVKFGINPRYLLDVAEALNAETVVVEVRQGDAGQVVRPIVVRAGHAKGKGTVESDGVALVMPVKLP